MKNIVITGGTSGLGKELARLLVEQGNNVFILSRNCDTTKSNQIVCDVSNEESVKNAFEILKTKINVIDILINNAGYGLYGATELINMEDCKKQIDTNFYGVLFCSRYGLKMMKKGARIFNTSSACAMFVLPFRTLYCASKSAVNSLSIGMNMELADFGIKVVTVCPGDIKTNFTVNRVKCFETNEKYNDKINLCSEFVENRNNKRMCLEYATKKYLQIINKKQPKNMYIIGNKYKLAYILQQLLPTNMFYKAINKIFTPQKPS